MSRLASREGAAARLSTGPWQGLGAQIHGPALGGQYATITTPLPMMYLMRTTSQFVEDPHSNKWWRRKEVKILKLLEDDELRKLSKKFALKCRPLPWAEWPVSEALSTLLIAALVGRICVPVKKKR